MSGRPPFASRLRDERGILIGAAAKLVIFLVLLGLALFEGGSVIWARLSAQDTADSAASRAVTTYRDTRNIRRAHEEALAAVAEKDQTAEMTSFEVHSDGSVTVRVRKVAETVVIQHIGFLEGLTVARGAATIEAPSF
jgi:Flp pilus assembly protein TadG